MVQGETLERQPEQLEVSGARTRQDRWARKSEVFPARR
jgi:hypothetical protein